jgi:preprotein translocase subunit YajC
MFIFSILKFIFFVFLFFIILGIVAMFFLKRVVKKVSKNLNKQFNESEQGKTTTTQSNTRSQNSTNYKDKGEYIDFEEIK